LTAVTKDRDAGINGMGTGETGAAPPAWLTLPAVDQQLKLEIAGLSGPRSIVTEGRAVGTDRGSEDPADCRMKSSLVVRPQTAGRLRWIYACGEEHFIGIDIPDPGEMALIHDDFLDRLPTSAQNAAQPFRRKVIVQRLRSDRAVIELPTLWVQEKNRTQAPHVGIDQLIAPVQLGSKYCVPSFLGGEPPRMHHE